MPFPLLIPALFGLTTKAIAVIAVEATVATVAANVAHDAYQSLKENCWGDNEINPSCNRQQEG